VWAGAYCDGDRVEASMSKQSQLVHHATFGVDVCKGGCGTTLAYRPNIGEEAECPNCHMVHIIIDGGLLVAKE